MASLATLLFSSAWLMHHAAAADRYWDPLNNNSYLSTGYTTFAGATMIWNSTGGTTGIGFDTSPSNTTNAQWNAGDDGFINITPAGTVLAAPATTWYIRTGTSAPTVHNLTYDSTTAGSILVLASNSTSSAVSNVALTGGGNGASTWNVGSGDTMRLTSGGSIGGSTNVGVVNLVNGTGVTTVDFVKEGAGLLHIQSTGSTFTGNIRINAGAIQVNGNGSLGNAANSVYIGDGAKLTTNNSGTTLNNTRTFFLGSAAGSGTGIIEAQNSVTFNINALLADNGTGADNLQSVANSGTIVLSNPANTYSGTTTVSSGTLQVANLADGGLNSAIGTSSAAASNLLLNGGVLSVSGTTAMSTDRLFTIGGNTNISNNSSLAVNSLTFTSAGAAVTTAPAAATFTLGGSNQGDNRFAPSLSDGPNPLSFLKGGASRWTVTGAHTYTGTTTIGNGTAGGHLQFDGTLTGAGGAINVTAANTLSGTGTLARSCTVDGILSPGNAATPLGTLTLGGDLTFSATGSLAAKLGGTSASSVGGVANLTIDPAATVSVGLDAANLPSGSSYEIASYSGTLSGAFNPVVTVGGLGALQSRIAFSLDYATPGKVLLTQSGQAKSLTWTGIDGVTPTLWDVNATSNWAAPAAEKFFDLDTVLFDDTAESRVVEIPVNVTPTAISMNNNGANSYTISSTGGIITGPAAFTKSGTGSLTISGAHAFTGAFNINGGTVSAGSLGDAATSGALGRGGLAFNGGTLDYSGPGEASTRALTFGAGNGTLIHATDLTLTGVATGAGGITKSGAGVLTLTGGDYAGATTVADGILKMNSAAALGSPAGDTTILPGATLDVNGNRSLDQDEEITVGGAGFGGGGAIINSTTTAAQDFAKKVTLTGDTVFGGAGRWDVRIAGPQANGYTAGTDAFLHGNGHSLTKVGTSVLGLVGLGDMNLGNIAINGGTIIFHDAGNNDAAMMLASDTTFGPAADGGGNPYKITMQPGTTLTFFNSDGTRSREIEADGTGAAVIIQHNSNGAPTIPAHILTLDRKISAKGLLTLTSASAAVTTFNLTGGIEETEPGLALTLNGAGAIRLGAANNHTGGTTISAGVTRIGHDGALGTGPLSIGGATLSSDSATPRTISNAVTLTGALTVGDAVNNGPITFTSPIDAAATRRNLTFNSDATIAAGVLSTGTGGLGAKLGDGTLTLQGTTTQGNCIVEVQDGKLILDGNLTVNEGIRVMANTTAGNSATLEIKSGSVLSQTLASGNLRIGFESATIADGINSVDLHGTVTQTTGGTGGQVQLGSDSATATLNMHPGSVLATDGIIVAAAGNAALATNVVNINGGTIRALETTATFMQGLTSVNLLAGGVTIDTDGKDITIGQALQGSGALTKNGTGILSMSNGGSYAGNTTINDGTLALSMVQLADTADVAINGTGKLSLDAGFGITDTVDELRFDGVAQATGTWGATGSGATHIDDTRFAGTGTLTVTSGPSATPFQTWAAANGLDGTPGKEAGPTDDPDKDGMENLAEFAFGGLPLDSADRGILEVQAVDTSLDADTSLELVLTMEIRNGATFTTNGGDLVATLDGITYRIEGSTDLATFDTPVSEVTPALGSGSPTSGYTLRTFRLDTSNNLPGRGYIRGRVTMP